MMKRVYVYPMRSEKDLKLKSPYVYHFCKSIEPYFDIVNFGKQTKYGVVNILFYFTKAEYFFFNWIENVSYLQGLLFLVFFNLAKLFGKKIIWTHHNIHPHKANSKMSQYLMRTLQNKSDLVIAHTKESFSLLEGLDKSKILYSFHPFFQTEVIDSKIEKIYDILIWGNVRPSKGVEQFLEHLKLKNELNKFKIKIAGKFSSDRYFEEVLANYSSPTISIENKFLSHDEMRELHHKSRYVFFPYTGSSVLNSGALVTSIPYGTPIIGPSTGAFKELGSYELIYVYVDFDDVFEYIEHEAKIRNEDLKRFVKEHSWNNFGKVLYAKANNI